MNVSLIRGATAIADHLGIRPKQAAHLESQRMLPTFRMPGDSAPHATAGGLAEWRALGLLLGDEPTDTTRRNRRWTPPN